MSALTDALDAAYVLVEDAATEAYLDDDGTLALAPSIDKVLHALDAAKEAVEAHEAADDED